MQLRATAMGLHDLTVGLLTYHVGLFGQSRASPTS